jgi:hypothetical protein
MIRTMTCAMTCAKALYTNLKHITLRLAVCGGRAHVSDGSEGKAPSSS